MGLRHARGRRTSTSRRGMFKLYRRGVGHTLREAADEQFTVPLRKRMRRVAKVCLLHSSKEFRHSTNRFFAVAGRRSEEGSTSYRQQMQTRAAHHSLKTTGSDTPPASLIATRTSRGSHVQQRDPEGKCSRSSPFLRPNGTARVRGDAS